MDVFSFETVANKLKQNLQLTTSPRERALLISEFFTSLFSGHKLLMAEVYFFEFTDTLLSSLKYYTPFYIHPDETKRLLETIQILANLPSGERVKTDLIQTAERIKADLRALIRILNDEGSNELPGGITFFPVIEVTQKLQLGLLESVTVQLKKRTGDTTFHIIPSEREIEELISEQIKISWNAARILAGRFYKNISRGFDVYITFSKRSGYYKGNSLGAAIALDFTNELLGYHNAPVSLTTASDVAITGGLSEAGSLKPVSEDLIKLKLRAVFFSGINHFVIPGKDFSAANEELERLKKEFPKRNLKLVSTKSIDDILNRRDLVEIKRQSLFVRTAKFMRQNLAAVILIIALITMIYFTGWWDMDDNPVNYKRNGNIVTLINKNGKELMKKWIGVDGVVEPDTYLRILLLILDTDNDGKNEIIISNELIPETGISHGYSLGCYDRTGKELWRFQFTDTVSTNDGIYTPPYQIRILDHYIKNDEPVVLIAACNLNYPCAVINIKAKNGEPTGDTLWHPGHLTDGETGDFNEDGKIELVATAINNYYESAVVFSIDIDNLNGYLAADGEYKFKNTKTASFNKYVLLTKTDVTNFSGYRFNRTQRGHLTYHSASKDFSIFANEGNDYYKNLVVLYMFDQYLNLKMADPLDSYQVYRDSLISRGILKGPYTKTPEYRKILWESVRELEPRQ
ncbi:MAG: hypothetical protein Kow0098_04810 [Ignavibacteriaceae bacterium]